MFPVQGAIIGLIRKSKKKKVFVDFLLFHVYFQFCFAFFTDASDMFSVVKFLFLQQIIESDEFIFSSYIFMFLSYQ